MVLIYVVIAYALMFTLAFLYGQSQKNHGLIDVFWGLGFVLGAVVSWLYGPRENMVALVISSLVGVWGLRLAYYLFKRNHGKPEDKRYEVKRALWKDNFALNMFLKMYVLQLVLNLIINLPVIFANQKLASEFTVLTYVGLFFWMIGFFFEVVGDYQLAQFKKDKKNKGKIMDQGVWSLTRHPNYFGEVSMWWGIFLMAFSIGTHIGFIVSPLLVTYLLTQVSGVAMLERNMAGRKGWDAYTQKTSKFIPWFPKK